MIGRDASEISVSPRQNFVKPPPVPDTPTVTWMLPAVSDWNSSATASVTGYTVLEPSTVTRTCSWRCPPQPASPPATASATHEFAIFIALSNTPSHVRGRSAEHTSELQSLMRISYDVFCWKKKHKN